MGEQLIRRLVVLVPTVFVVVTLVFVVFRLVPGDPAALMVSPDAPPQDRAMIEHQLGLDRPIAVQYVAYLGQVVRGNLGKSLYSGQSVLSLVLASFPWTLQLALASLVIAAPLGIALGVIAAVRAHTVVDFGSVVLAVFGSALPNFWIGLMLMVLLSVKLGWLPSSGTGGLRHLVLPAFSLGLPATAIIARLTRSSMIDVLNQDYVRTARAKGLRERAVIVRHVLRNSMIPTVMVIGLYFGYLLGGSVIIETLFAWPGLGQLLISAVRSRDYPVVQGAILLFAINFILINAIVDSLIMFMDPRSRKGS